MTTAAEAHDAIKSLIQRDGNPTAAAFLKDVYDLSSTFGGHDGDSATLSLKMRDRTTVTVHVTVRR